MLVALLACSSPTPASTSTSTPSTSASGPVAGDTLVVAANFDPGNLNPIVAPYQLSGYYIGVTQLGLVERRADETGLLHVPALAESWEWSEDGRTVTFQLMEGIIWSDGQPVTARDAAFTFELILDESVASNWFAASKKIEAVEVVDDRHVAFRFFDAGLKPYMMDELRHGLLPEHVLRDADRSSIRGHEYSRMPMATGPWKLASWDKEAKLVLEPNDSVVARPRPHLSRVITKIVPEYATQLIELENGSVDMLFQVELPDVPALKREHPEIELLVEPASGMEYLGWNNADPMFSDARVRRAMTLAIDVDRIISDMFEVEGHTYASRCLGTVGPNTGAWINPDIEALPYDPEAAKALLDEAGWTDTDGDGVRDRGGQKMTVTVMIQNGIVKSEKVVIRVQAQLAQIGVDLQIQALEPNLFSSRARAHDFQAILWGFGNNPKVDPTIQWHSTGQYNWMSYRSPEVDRLLDEAMATSDLEAAQDKVRQVQALVYADQPATFLFWEDNVGAIHSRFRDVEQNTFTAFVQLERWYVPTEEQKYR